MADENETIEDVVEVSASEESSPDATAGDAAVEPEAEKLAPITTATTPQQRKAARTKAKLAESGARPARTPEERQAERDALRKAKAAARTRQRGQARAKYKASDHERVPTPPREHVVGLKKTRQGIVVSDKAAKTITVRIDVARPHRKYKKIVRTSMTLHAHDESNNAHLGDTVVVTESRPLSATKRWRLVEVVERAK
jgi:small subunit ribosomal protein S17